MKEIWKSVVGHEGAYQVSNKGRVRSLDHVTHYNCRWGSLTSRHFKGRVLKPGKCRDYLIVNLSGWGTTAVHLLVAKAHVAGEAPGKEVNHIDGIKAHCWATNLEWLTKKENLDHAVDLGLNSQAIKVVCPLNGQIFKSIARAERIYGKCAREWERLL